MNKVINFYKRNLKELLRDPIIYIFCLGFPIAMFLLFYIINKFSNGHTPTFEVLSLLPGIIVFSYSFVMLTLAIIVSKDKQTFFLKRLYSSPMKSYHFILGYFLVGLFIGVLQTIICISTGFIISLISNVGFISIGKMHHVLVQTFITNIVVYMTSLILYLCGVWTPTLNSIILLFNLGVIISSIYTITVYIIENKRSKRFK